MPSPELATALQSTLKALTDVTAGRTTFASNLVTLLNAAFGASNPFGTAATADTGTAENNVPVLGVGGTLAPTVLPDASTSAPGAVTIAANLDDTSPTAVVPPSLVNAAVSGLQQGLRASVFGLTRLQLNTPMQMPGKGFLIASSGGAGGASGNGNAGANGEAMTIQYGAGSIGSFTTSLPTITVAGGGPTAPSFQILTFNNTPEVATREPKFAFVRGGQGARGGRSAFTLGSTGRFPMQSGANGNLLVAFFDIDEPYLRMTADGTGGAGASGGNTGEGGNNGFAFFVRVE